MTPSSSQEADAMSHDETIRDHALGWAVRVGDPEFADWDGFTAWLEESPAHARAYDAITADVADAADLIGAVPGAANDDVPAALPPVRRRWVLGALAASLALVVGLGVWQTQGGRYAVETAPGEMRRLALADGGSVVLSGGTRLELDRGDPRFARLESGQALFTVTHDAANPFAVEVGDDRLVDAGTVFDVAFDQGDMQVAVSEGLVVFNPGRQGVEVSPGHMLTKRAGRDFALAAVDPGQVGEWRSGRLTFDNAPLDAVAARLSRATGIAFRAKPGSGGAVSGSVLVAPVRKDPQSLGPLLGATVRRDGDHWEIATN